MPTENEEEDMERQLAIPPIKVPSFAPHIPAADVQDLGTRDTKLILVQSVLAQQSEFSITMAQEHHNYITVLAAECREGRKFRKTYKRRLAVAGTVIGLIVTTLTGGLLTNVANFLFQLITGTK